MVASGSDAARQRQRNTSCFVPNLGQWEHAARFVHRSGRLTLFLTDRGWIMDLLGSPSERAQRAVALRMTFEQPARAREIAGECKLPGHHCYFLGGDPSRWRTHVPLYESVRYTNLYPDIDLRMRQTDGVPEYDLLLQPGADLAGVAVRVEGGERMSLAADGSLVIDTALGALTQPMPRTWQVNHLGERREVACHFTLLGPDRFGFAAPGWDRHTRLTIDPGLIWSTFFGGAGFDTILGVSVDARGLATVAGATTSPNLPTTVGAYEMQLQGNYDAFVSRLDPSKTGAAQLVYSTFLGGKDSDVAQALGIDGSGVVTVVGGTRSGDFPATAGAFDTSFGAGGDDAFVARLDPSKTGRAQLIYATFLGGGSSDRARALAVGAGGVVTVTGDTSSTDFPTTGGAFLRVPRATDAFVTRLDPRKSGAAQLLYSTFLGGSAHDRAYALSVDSRGVATVAGQTQTKASNFPTTSGAFDRTPNGGDDVFVSRLDPGKVGAGQLVFSTLLGGSQTEQPLSVSAADNGIVTLAGHVMSSDFPTAGTAYDTTHNGSRDAFVSRLDPSKQGAAQLVYSTFFGGSGDDDAWGLVVDPAATVTFAGTTKSNNLPTTSNAFDATFNGIADAFVSRLDLIKPATTQLVYSTFLGSDRSDQGLALAVDRGGVATLAGISDSLFRFPITPGAFDATHNGGFTDGFVSRVSMGLGLWADRHELSLKQGGTQTLTLDAGAQHANKTYLLLGTLSGTAPGIGLGNGRILPLNPDPYFTLTLLAFNSPLLTNTLGKLDGSGMASARWNVIPQLPQPPAGGFHFHHAYVVLGASPFDAVSNPVPLTVVK